MITRWVCKECTQKWMYPLMRCPLCNKDVSIERSHSLTVVGETKVSIPSPEHPVIPYHVLLLEDGSNNRMAKKVMSPHTIGSSFVMPKAKSENAVSIARVAFDLEGSFAHCLSLLPHLVFSREDKALICLDLSSPLAVPFLYPSPALLGTLITHLRSQGVSDIIATGQSPIIESSPLLKKLGFMQLLEKENVPFVEWGALFTEQATYMPSTRKLIVFSHLHIDHKGVHGALSALPPTTSMHDGTSQPSLTLSPFCFIADALTSAHAARDGVSLEPLPLNLFFAGRDAKSIDLAFESISTTSPTHEPSEVVGEALMALKREMRRLRPHTSAHRLIPLYDFGSENHTYARAQAICQSISENFGFEISLVLGNAFSASDVACFGRIVAFGDLAIERFRSLKIKPALEIAESVPAAQAASLMRLFLQDGNKKKLGIADTFKAKLHQ